MINDILYLIQCDNVVGGYCQQSYIIRPGIVGHNTINSNAIVQLIISNCFKMGGNSDLWNKNFSFIGFTCFLEPDCISEELLHFYPAFAEQMPTEPWK